MMNTLSMEQNTSESPSESIHHAANAFSTKDTAPGVDELVRKQRVIRYMEEERERGNRTQILREEHEYWVHLRSGERSERLQYMSEEEIASLLKREAEEMERERNISVSQERGLSFTKSMSGSPRNYSESHINVSRIPKESLPGVVECERSSPWKALLEEKDALITQLRSENAEMIHCKRDLERKKIEWESLLQQEEEMTCKLLEEKKKQAVCEKQIHELTARVQREEMSTLELRCERERIESVSKAMEVENNELKQLIARQEETIQTLEVKRGMQEKDLRKMEKELEMARNLARELQETFDVEREEKKVLKEQLTCLEERIKDDECRRKLSEDQTLALVRSNAWVQQSFQNCTTQGKNGSETTKQELLGRIATLEDLARKSKSDAESYALENKALKNELEKANKSTETTLLRNRIIELIDDKKKLQEKASCLSNGNADAKKRIEELALEKGSIYNQLQEEIALRQKFEDLAAQAVNADQERFLEISRRGQEEVQILRKQLEKSQREYRMASKDQETVITELKNRCKHLRKQLIEVQEVRVEEDVRNDSLQRKNSERITHSFWGIEAPWIERMQGLEKENRILVDQLAFYANRLQVEEKRIKNEDDCTAGEKVEKTQLRKVKFPVHRNNSQVQSKEVQYTDGNIQKQSPKSKASKGCC